MPTKEIAKQTENDFEKAWEEFGELHAHTPRAHVPRKYARFFFFAGAQAGVNATHKLCVEQFGPLEKQIDEVLA